MLIDWEKKSPTTLAAASSAAAALAIAKNLTRE